MNKWAEKYDGLIFDCDGTLVDTMPTHYIAWHAIMAKYGIDFPEKRFYALGGVPVKDIIKLLANEAGKQLDIEKIVNEKEDAFLAKLNNTSLIKEVVSIAEANRGVLPMGVASGTAKWAVLKELGHFGITDWFDAIVTCDDVGRPKPNPDVFLEAAHRIGVDPKKCCAFEDSPLGMQAARAAGMDVVDVGELR